MSFLYVLFALVAFILFIIGKRIYYTSVTKPQQTKIAKENYDQALLSGNKTEALKAGRLYYSWLRNGDLSIYDEQAITNDMATMNS